MQIRTLLIEDNPGDARLVKEALKEVSGARFDLDHAPTLGAGLDKLRGAAWDVVLLDLSLPDSHGLETLLKVQAKAPAVPVVILTGLEDEGMALAAMRGGAQDYLVKGRIDGPALSRSIRYAIERKLAAAVVAPDANPGLVGDLRRHLDLLEAEHALLVRLLGNPPPPARPSEEARFETGALAANRYRLASLLGEGTFGRAFLAQDETLRRRVVLKALHARFARDDDAVRSFLKEARLAASVEHPNVIRIYDFGYAAETPYIVMEHAEGGSLQAALSLKDRFSAVDASRVIEQVLTGLSVIHSRGILHRDLKPGNILLSIEGVAKIADFGLALVEDATATQTGLEESGFGEGTPAYMSPEAVRGLPLTPASDVYSAGALLYEMLTGETYLPLKGRRVSEIRRAILDDAPSRPRHALDAGIQKVMLKALEKDPRKRFPSAAAMQSALRETSLSSPA